MFRQSVVAQNEAVTADTQVTYDLPVKPLSFVVLTLLYQQNKANDAMSFVNVPEILDRVEILYKGSPVYSANGIDCLALGLFLHHFWSWGVNADGNDDDYRSFSFLLPLTRTLYSLDEAFPGVSRGELVLQITYAASFTDLDNVRCQVEAYEVPEASPTQYAKTTTLVGTPAAAGQFDVELPLGNKISDIVVFATTIPLADADTTTAHFLELLINNSEVYYTGTNFETIHNLGGRLGRDPSYWGYHVHRLTAAAYAQWDDTGPVIPADHVLKQHLHLPFDIFRDGQHLIDATDLSNAVLRFDAGDTNAIRVLPVEVIETR